MKFEEISLESCLLCGRGREEREGWRRVELQWRVCARCLHEMVIEAVKVKYPGYLDFELGAIEELVKAKLEKG